jgi:xylulose-5-phosphate/fructose-6-phosphate phosphoketolase
VASTYLEGTYGEVYPSMTPDEEGLRGCSASSPSRRDPQPRRAGDAGLDPRGRRAGLRARRTPTGRRSTTPTCSCCCVVGDGEAETGPLAASWHSNKFVDPARDGAVLPILHLNGYKIANPTVLARIPHDELRALLVGYGHEPYFVEGDDPATMHQLHGRDARPGRRATSAPSRRARDGAGARERPRWPMIVLRTPKGWTGPQGGRRPADRGHLPRPPGAAGAAAESPEHLAALEAWMRSYRPRSCSTTTARGRRRSRRWRPTASAAWAPTRTPTAACCCATCRCPTSATTRWPVEAPGTTSSEATRVLGGWLRDVMRANAGEANFRVFGPTRRPPTVWTRSSRRPTAPWMAERRAGDDHLAPDGRVMEVLSEHLCQGWLEGYLLTGRHGFFNCYEAFIHIIDSMFNQHAKWLKVTRGIPWRRPIASLNYLLSSHVWRQDHNGFSHQDPASSTTSSTRRPRSSASTCRRTPTRFCR